MENKNLKKIIMSNMYGTIGNPKFRHISGTGKNKCPLCKSMLDFIHDNHGLYFKCDHCKWDSQGLYKTKNKCDSSKSLD